MWNKKILYSALVCIASLGLYAQPVIRQAHSNRFPATYDRWQEGLMIIILLRSIRNCLFSRESYLWMCMRRAVIHLKQP